MRKYQVMIDDAISSQSFSLDELLEAGLLDDYDVNIKVRATNETTWKIAREYPFHLSESNTISNTDYIVNEDGTVTRKKKNNSGVETSTTPNTPRGYRIDEYGQVVRTGASSTSRLDLSTDSLYFTSSSDSRSITVTTNGTWNISLDAASWVHLSQCGSTLNVRVDQNYSSDSRSDFFKLKSGNKEKRVDIYQSGNTSSSSSSSSNNDNDGCAWLFWIAVGIGILAAILK